MNAFSQTTARADSFFSRLAAVSCRHLSALQHNEADDAAQLLQGRIRFRKIFIPIEKALTANEVPSGLRASWLFHYHSLAWADVLRCMYLTTQEQIYRGRMIDCVLAWLRNHGVPPAQLPTTKEPGDFTWYDMGTSFRVDIMIGLYSIVDDEAIKEELAAHIATHKSALLDEDYYAQIGNHALHQNNALLSAALFFDDQAALDVSLNRIKALCAASVDEEGVCTEGAPAYHAFNAHWIHQTLGRLQFATEFYSIPMPVIQDMRPFTAQCIAPDGFYVPFGDTFMGRSPLATEFRARFGEAYCAYLMESPELAFALTMGREGCPPKASLAVFKEGYCFSRRRHNDDPASDSLCAMRFGAGLTTRVHAHDDGGSLVYYPRGMRLLEDGGMYGYYGGRYRTFVQSTMAHNVVTSFSKKYYRSAVNELTYAESTEESDIIEVKVQALEKSRWSRKILHHKLHDCLFVEDVIASTDDSLFQNWNFSEGISVVNVLKNRIDVEGERIRASLLWLCDDIRLEISCGRSNPMLGWASSDESEIHRILSIQAWARKDAAKLPVLIFPLNPAMDFESLCLKDVTLRTRQTQFTITLDGRDLNFNLSIPA